MLFFFPLREINTDLTVTVCFGRYKKWILALAYWCISPGMCAECLLEAKPLSTTSVCLYNCSATESCFVLPDCTISPYIYKPGFLISFGYCTCCATIFKSVFFTPICYCYFRHSALVSYCFHSLTVASTKDIKGNLLSSTFITSAFTAQQHSYMPWHMTWGIQ